MTTQPTGHSWDIDDLLHRRTDLSTFVIHWTRATDDATPFENLINILLGRRINARSPMGTGVYELRRMAQEGLLSTPDLEAALETQRVVCLTEAPLEQAWSLVCTIQGRQVALAPFGLAFTKTDARRLGINPVWYMDMTPGHDWLTNEVADLVRRAAARGDFASDPIAKIAPFMEGMGTWPGLGRKEFWWEREWRHLGDLNFVRADVAVVMCPEEEMESVGEVMQEVAGTSLPLIDPNWGLEHIIAHLSGVWGR